MIFRLENLLPEPLEGTDVSTSQVWNRSLEIHPGFIRLRAASGKGKTTLIHILYGRRKDYTGTVSLDEEGISTFNPGRWALIRQKHLSIVFQELMLFGELTGWENIHLKNRLTGHYDKDRIHDMSKRMNARHLLEKKCGIMSFGERQRIAIIRSLVQPFDWLLLDEPFSHLDEANSRIASALITEECQLRNAGMLVTSLDEDDFINYDKTIIV